MRRLHSHLHRAEGMFDCLATLTHGLRVLVEALLYCLHHILMLPSRDPTLLAGGAAILERHSCEKNEKLTQQKDIVF